MGFTKDIENLLEGLEYVRTSDKNANMLDQQSIVSHLEGLGYTEEADAVRNMPSTKYEELLSGESVEYRKYVRRIEFMLNILSFFQKLGLFKGIMRNRILPRGIHEKN